MSWTIGLRCGSRLFTTAQTWHLIALARLCAPIALSSCVLTSAIGTNQCGARTLLNEQVLVEPQATIAQKVADVRPWTFNSYTLYWWLGKDDVLLMRPGWRFSKLNTINGEITALPLFDDAFGKSLAGAGGGAIGAEPGLPIGCVAFDVAPDGRHILWQLINGTVFSAEINGNAFRRIVDGDLWLGRWAGTNGRWIDFKKDLGQPYLVSSARIHTAKTTVNISFPGVISRDSYLADVRCRSSNSIIRAVVVGLPNSFGNIETAILNIPDTAAPVSVDRYSYPTPGGNQKAVVEAAVLSPDCARLVCVLRSPIGSASPAREAISMYLCDITGNRLRLLATVDSKQEDQSGDFHDVRWLPDNSAISFVRDSILWKLAVQ